MSDCESDWIASLDVASHYLKDHCAEDSLVNERKILLLSDLGCPSKHDAKFDSILEKIAADGIEVSFL